MLGDALAQVLRLTDPPPIVVAGRTDAGVHARGQVAHVDLPQPAWDELPGRSTLAPKESLRRALRGVLPSDVRVHAVTEAPAGFDARFSALWRRYAYRVCDAPSGVPPLRRHDVLGMRASPSGLDVDAMNAACASLVGLHDFAAFCRRRQGATTVRALLEYSWSHEVCDDGLLVVARVVADAFCHSMVRALVGGALAVGEHRREPDWLSAVLRAGVRDPAVTVVPAHALVLEAVGYPDASQLADRAAASRAVRTLPGPIPPLTPGRSGALP